MKSFDLIWIASFQVINETGYGRKSDIWSVGCTVFEMATGKPPLAHMDKMAALFYIGAQRGLMPSLPEGFSDNAKDFVKICLTRWELLSSWVHNKFDCVFCTVRCLIHVYALLFSFFPQLQWPETTTICRPAAEALIYPPKWDRSELCGNTEKELLWSPRGTVWLIKSYTRTDFFLNLLLRFNADLWLRTL